jgi:hypothetical protein
LQQPAVGRYSNRQLQRYVDKFQQHQTLRLGMNSPEVETLQQQLNDAGATLAVDGHFGSQTRQAVIRFQQAAGLAPDGVVGSQTWASLSGGGVKIPPSPAATGQMIAAKLQQINTLVKNRKQQRTTLKQQSLPDIEADETDHSGHAHDWGHDDEESWWDSATDWVEEQVDSATDWVEDKSDSAAEWVDEKVDSATDWLDETAGDVWDSVSDSAGDVWDSVSDTASEVWDSVKDTATEIVDDLSEIVDDVSDLVGDGFDKLKDIANGIWGDDPLSFLDELIEDLMGSSDKEEGPMQGSAAPVSGGSAGPSVGCDLPVRFEPTVIPTVNEQSVQDPLAADVSRPGEVTMGSSIHLASGIPLHTFGYAEPRFSANSITWRFEDSYITINANVMVDCLWGISPNGKMDIADPESDNVTENNWDTITWDLKPDGGGIPMRSSFWSSPITSAHEIFHCNEYIAEAKSSLYRGKNELSGKHIQKPIGWISDSDEAEINSEVRSLVLAMVKVIKDDVQYKYRNGGEVRAYAAGKSAYEALVKGVKKRAKREGWDKSE